MLHRQFFICAKLDEMEAFEETLERSGIAREQIHALSFDDRSVDRRANLNEVVSLTKKDVLRSGWIGLAVGIAAAIVVLLVAALTGWTSTAAGWVPFIFLAIVVLGFCTWEGGLWGIQTLNHEFRQFESALSAGRHILYIDVTAEQQNVVDTAVQKHPSMKLVGVGSGQPYWIIKSNKGLKAFLGRTMP